MNTDQIAYLIDISKTGSINTTAKRMFCSQQAVSEAIKRLEQELDCTILKRSKRGVTLTEDGKYVLQQIMPMMEQYQSLQQHFHEANAPSGNLHIGVAQFATSIILPNLIFEMYRQYPNITLFTEEMPIQDIISGVFQGEIDFGIAGFSDDGDFPLKEIETNALSMKPLYTDNVVCVMHRNNPYSAEKMITEQHLAHMKFTSYNNYQAEKGIRNILHISGNTQIHKKFMQEENTICMVNSFAYKVLYPEKEYVAIPVEHIRPVVMCLFYHKQPSNIENPVYQTFIQTAEKLAEHSKNNL